MSACLPASYMPRHRPADLATRGDEPEPNGARTERGPNGPEPIRTSPTAPTRARSDPPDRAGRARGKGPRRGPWTLPVRALEAFLLRGNDGDQVCCPMVCARLRPFPAGGTPDDLPGRGAKRAAQGPFLVSCAPVPCPRAARRRRGWGGLRCAGARRRSAPRPAPCPAVHGGYRGEGATCGRASASPGDAVWTTLVRDSLTGYGVKESLTSIGVRHGIP